MTSPSPSRAERTLAWVSLLWLVLLFFAPAAAVTGTGNGFLLVQLPSTGVFQAALVEAAMTTELLTRFPTSQSVRCVDIRVTNAVSYPAAATTMPFDLLFLIGSNPLTTTSSTALSPIQVDSAGLQADLAQSLAATAPAGLSVRVLAAATVSATYGTLPTLQPVAAPSSGVAFLRVDMTFRNLLSPLNLTQSLLFQTRRGIQRFINLVSPTQVVATGPAQAPPSSVLLLTQSFFVVLNNNGSDATMENRQRLANLLIYGDPSRLITENSIQRPAMFLDYAADDPLPDPTALLTLPYVFSSLSVDVFPSGNPPAPTPDLPPGTVVIPATPTDQLLANVRKRHVFQFNASALPSPMTQNVGCPSASGGGICVHLQWNNSLDGMAFWLESLESVDALAWNLSPATPFCATPQTPLPLLSSPLVLAGAGDSAVWSLAALSPSPRVAFALHLRSLDDNATRVTVEISADIRSAMQAATTVTSISRRVDATPVYASRSNVVVAYDSLFRAGSSEIVLSLSLQASEITQKDTSQPCAHCQNLFEWCAANAACQALANCVVRDGFEAAQTPATLLQQPSLVDAVADVSPIVRRCVATAELDALLLFSSALRCQLQRMCAARTAANYGLAGLDDRVLLWEASDGVVQLTAPAPLDATAFNLTLRLLGTPLCSLVPNAFASPNEIEEFVARQCQFASYLGRVVVAVNASASSLELRFQDFVGLLPTVEVSPSSAQVVVTALPSLRLRLELADFATALPPLPPATPVDGCRASCRRLALDGCLRDLACVAFTDCIARFVSPSSADGGALGDALLALFERRIVGESLSLREAVGACHSQQSVTDPAWRKLVDASTCFAKNDCDVSLQGVVLPPAPDGDAVVGKLRFVSSPVALQRLFYQQQDPAEAAPAAIPLALVDAQGATIATASSSLDSSDLERALRALLQYDDVGVRLVGDSTDGGLRVVQWEIAFSFWVSRLPQFVAATQAPRWRLVAMPTEQPLDYAVVMASGANATQGGVASNATTNVVEITAAAVTVS